MNQEILKSCSHFEIFKNLIQNSKMHDFYVIIKWEEMIRTYKKFKKTAEGSSKLEN